MDSKTTKSTLTHLFGESEPTKKSQYFDFLMQLISLFTITRDELYDQNHSSQDNDDSWAAKVTSRHGSFREVMYYILLHNESIIHTPQKLSYAKVLAYCFDFADDLIISSIIILQYEALLSSLRSIQEKFEESDAKIADFQSAYQDVADPQYLQTFIQAHRQSLEVHSREIRQQIYLCSKALEATTEYHKNTWRLAIGDHTIDECWEKLASKDSWTGSIEQYQNQIFNLRMQYDGFRHHPNTTKEHQDKNNRTHTEQINLDEIIGNLKKNYQEVTQLVKQEQSNTIRFLATINSLVDLSEQTFSLVTTPNNEPN